MNQINEKPNKEVNIIFIGYMHLLANCILYLYFFDIVRRLDFLSESL